jgi:predicted phage baseplate assembly protein
MPLEDYIPNLDDHTYDSILAEMRARIARYTPEWKPVWTDVNDSDPGITMLQVFAWLSDMLTYRMNQVPDLNYLKFLQLIGIELRPAQPAYAEITFPVIASFNAPTTIVPIRTQVTAEMPGGGPPLVFEADRSLVALTAKLVSLLAYDGYSFSLVTDGNEAASGFQPFGPLANADSALLFGFDYAGPFPKTEFTLFAWVGEESNSQSAVTCGLPSSAAFAPATLVWEFWDGLSWAGLVLLKDDTLAFTRTGEIILSVPETISAKTTFAPETRQLYWIRARVAKSQYERPPRLAAIRTNTMRLTQMETVVNEVLGGSNGRRDQVFRLENVPVLEGSLVLEIDQGSGYEVWTEVDDFFASGPNDLHYTLNRTTGEIRFGDGFNGAIPIAAVNNPGSNVVATQYRYGGGTKGNVPGGTLNALRNAVTGIDDNGITNLMPSFGGTDEETLDLAKRRAPMALRSQCRAVTAGDFEYFAMQAGNVARARAFPLFHPDFPGVQIPGVITVVIVPDSASPAPMPSDGLLRTVCAYLDQRRLLTTEVYVVPPTYQKVSVAVDVIASDTADLAQVKRDISSSLLDYLHPLRGGEDGQGWPFGGTIYFSRIFQRVLSVAGVDTVERVVITLDGLEQPECKDVPIENGALVYSLSHDVSVNYRVNGGRA